MLIILSNSFTPQIFAQHKRIHISTKPCIQRSQKQYPDWPQNRNDPEIHIWNMTNYGILLSVKDKVLIDALVRMTYKNHVNRKKQGTTIHCIIPFK